MRNWTILCLAALILVACTPNSNPSKAITETPSQTIVSTSVQEKPTIAPTLELNEPLATATEQSPAMPEISGYLPDGALRNAGQGEIYDMAVSPDGSQIAIGSAGGVYVLDGQNYHEVAFLPTESPNYLVNSLDYSGDGTYLIAIATFQQNKDQYLYCYQTSDFQLVRKISFPRKVGYSPPILSASPVEPLVAVIVDGQQVTTWNYEDGTWKGVYVSPGTKSFIRALEFGADGRLFIVNDARVIAMTSDGEITQRYETQFNQVVWDITISHDGNLAAAYQDKRMVVWDVNNGKEILRDETIQFAYTPTYFPEIVFSEDDHSIFLANTEGLKSWELQGEQGNEQVEIKLPERALTIERLALLPDLRLVGISVDMTLAVINIDDKSVVYSSTDFFTSPAAFSFSPEGNLLALSSGSGWKGNVVRVVDTKNEEVKATLTGWANWVSSLQFSPSGKFLSILYWIWERSETGTYGPRCAAGIGTFSTDEKFFAGNKLEGFVISNLPNCDVRHTFIPSDENSRFAISKDFSKLAEGAQDGSIRIYDVESEALLSTLSSPANEPVELTLSEDGKYVAKSTGSPSPRTRIWDTATGELVANIAASKPEFIGERVFTLAKGVVNVWDLAENKALTPVAPVVDDWIVISPDGKLVAASGQNNQTRSIEIQVLDSSSGKELYRYNGHTPGVSPAKTVYLFFSADSQELISTGPDGTVLVWSTNH